MNRARLVVVSCPRRRPIQEIWRKVQSENWSDCPFSIDILSPNPDIGWNANLIRHLETLSEEFILLLLDDNFMVAGPWTDNMNAVLDLLVASPDIAMVKLQAGGAHGPEIPFVPWDRIREYDREHHPFKRTNLNPAMYRRQWLLKLSKAVLEACGPERDIGRNGALEFEVTGTFLTADDKVFPERMLGIHRPGVDGSGGNSLLECIANDAVREGRLQPIESLQELCEGVEGIEAFL